MHALQSAEAARKDGQPRWMILTALIHDLGKLLFFHGEPQWAVVGVSSNSTVMDNLNFIGYIPGWMHFLRQNSLSRLFYKQSRQQASYLWSAVRYL